MSIDVGPILLAIVIVVFVPLIMVGGMAVAGVLGWRLKQEVEGDHEGSELIALNR